MAYYAAEEIDAVAQWMQDGHTASQIAKLIGERFGRTVSRHSVIGLAFRSERLKAIGFQYLARRAPAAPKTPSKPRPCIRSIGIVDRTVRRKADPGLPAITPSAFDNASLRLPLADLDRHQCRFPVNDSPDPAGHLFCGLPVADASYCAHHTKRALGGTP